MIDHHDISGKIGPLYGSVNPNPEWPMYSYERPAWIVWNAVATSLHNRGWKDDAIKDWLQSKNPRWSLDGSFGEALEDLAKKWADENI